MASNEVTDTVSMAMFHLSNKITHSINLKFYGNSHSINYYSFVRKNLFPADNASGGLF